MNEDQIHKTQWLAPLVLEGGVSVQFRNDHVHVQLGTDLKVSSEQRNLIWGLIGRACQENGTSRVLVEGRAPEGIFQPTEVVDAGLKTATVPRLWLAFCFGDFKPDERSELYETVAGSKGVRVKFFSNTGSALSWLRTNARS
ncbi:MAG: hypothetical protein IPM25_15955 [Chloracidobacterium sp.]|nr:hypothetical protein [Chloracidobacterium sp.]